MNIDAFIAEEVERQRWVPGTPDFDTRVMWMHDAWRYAQSMRRCPSCKGSGEEGGEASVDADNHTEVAERVPCPPCAGRGFFYPHLHDFYNLGFYIEREENFLGWRKKDVFHADDLRPIGIEAADIPQKMMELAFAIPGLMGHEQGPYSELATPVWVYKEFEEIHPFIDGNGRVGKVIYCWLMDTLEDPEFPPSLWPSVPDETT